MNERTRNKLVAQAAEDQAAAVAEIHKVADELNEKMDRILELIEATHAPAETPAAPKPGKAKTDKAAES